MTPREVLNARPLDAFVAATSVAVGLWAALPFTSMNGAPYAVILQAAPEVTWGLFFMFNGLYHMLALGINGHRWWSPILRWFAALTSGLGYVGFSLAFAAANWQSTAVPVYLLLALGSAMCMRTSWRDARTSVGIFYATRD